MKKLIVIDNDILEVTEIYNTSYGKTFCSGGRKYRLFKHRDDAVDSVIDYYTNMANNEPDELVYLIGTECLIKWALGNYASLGYITTKNFTEWIEIVSNNPKELWASYDGIEIDDVQFNKHFAKAFDIEDTDSPVLYRTN